MFSPGNNEERQPGSNRQTTAHTYRLQVNSNAFVLLSKSEVTDFNPGSVYIPLDTSLGYQHQLCGLQYDTTDSVSFPL